MKVSEHCLCGASATGSIRPDAAARKVINLFWQGHQGEGHGPSTTSMAQESRRREEYFLPPEERQRLERRRLERRRRAFARRAQLEMKL